MNALVTIDTLIASTAKCALTAAMSTTWSLIKFGGKQIQKAKECCALGAWSCGSGDY